MNTKSAAIGYFKGDAGEYTGKVEQLHGGTFYELRMTEGHLKGQVKLVTAPPKPTSWFAELPKAIIIDNARERTPYGLMPTALEALAALVAEFDSYAEEMRTIGRGHGDYGCERRIAHMIVDAAAKAARS